VLVPVRGVLILYCHAAKLYVRRAVPAYYYRRYASHPNSRSDPGVFRTYFYNHKPRPSFRRAGILNYFWIQVAVLILKPPCDIFHNRFGSEAAKKIDDILITVIRHDVRRPFPNEKKAPVRV
jgi:hypothetical protein